MHVLLIKLSSIGDIIHTMPALSDAMEEVPGIKFTWIVDQKFAEIPAMHPAVNKVIPLKIRDFDLKQVFSTIKKIRQSKFDLILDAQGLIKSALFAYLSGSKEIFGLSYDSCKEPLASIFYRYKVAIAKKMHAIDRIRKLFAKALGYNVPLSAAKYSLQISCIDIFQSYKTKYLFFLHGTTWNSKHWPEEYWKRLADIVAIHGYKIKITWDTLQQKKRAQMLADYSKSVIMLPNLTIQKAVREINTACCVIAVDTGFAHLAEAINKPVVAIFGATDASKSGLKGKYSINLVSNFACSPCMHRNCYFSKFSNVTSPCMQELYPELVWKKIKKLLCCADNI